jgi:hypothetical protein
MMRLIPCLLAALLAAACTAPRSVLNSPEALPKGRWQVGANMDVNLPTQTADKLYGGLKKGLDALSDKASKDGNAAVTADSLNGYVIALMAYSVDPISPQTGVFIRYGFRPGLDGGYRYSSGCHGFDLRWQFLGPLADDSAAGDASAWRGSIGAQYSWQSFELPSVAGLDKLQDLLAFEFKRKNILLPVMVGKPFGEHGRYGGFGFGLAYNLSLIDYGSDILKLMEKKSDGTTAPFPSLHGSKAISSYGGFYTLRAGYRWAYLIGSFAAYWQDYGEFELFGGRKESLAGWTFLPTLGMEFRF